MAPVATISTIPPVSSVPGVSSKALNGNISSELALSSASSANGGVLDDSRKACLSSSSLGQAEPIPVLDLPGANQLPGILHPLSGSSSAVVITAGISKKAEVVPNKVPLTSTSTAPGESSSSRVTEREEPVAALGLADGGLVSGVVSHVLVLASLAS